MINKLTQSPPSEITVGGIVYKINLSLSAAMDAQMFIEAYYAGDFGITEDGKPGEKARDVLSLALNNSMYLPPKPPWDCEETLSFIFEYFDWFKSDFEGKKSRMPAYGYSALLKDGDLIKSALRADGYDVRKLSYEDFLDLLPEISQETTYSRLQNLRYKKYNHSSKLTKEEKEAIAAFGARMEIPNPIKEKQKRENKTHFNNLREQILKCCENNCEWAEINGVCKCSREFCEVNRERKTRCIKRGRE
jgi:hypothetical protein